MITIVTGAAGMIGSGVVRYLNDLKIDSLLLVDDLKSGLKWKNLLGKRFLGIISKNKLFQWLEGREGEVDAIVHLGACSDTVETNVDYLLENNFQYTVRLAEWALTHNKRFIYASSAATYGDGSLGFCDDEAMLEEFRPLNPYGFSKQLADLWMKRQGVLHRVVGLKYFNIFGPNENHKGRMASMVFKMMHTAQSGAPIQLFKSNDAHYSDGGQMRDFLYVKDAAKMTCAFLQKRDVGGLFNIGQGTATTWNALAGALFSALAREQKIGYVDMPADLARQYQNYTCARMEKFQSHFALQPTPIPVAVADYVQNYLLQDARW